VEVKKFVAACVGVCGSVVLSSAYSQESDVDRIRTAVLEEVVVTAQKRGESLQEVPIAISALSGDQLAERQIRTAADLMMSVPNLQVNSPLGESVPIFSLRGISMSDFGLAQNGPIAVYYDEVYKGNLAILGLGMFDLERVEVLKGPQGTLYGKNTTGGAINFIAKKPEFETGGNLSVGYGKYDHYSADGAFQTPLSESWAARMAFTFDRADGWMRNAFPGAPDGSATRQYGLRGSLRYNPSDIVDIVIRASTSLQNPRNYTGIALPGPEGIGGEIYGMFGLPADFREGLGKREINTPDISKRRQRTHALAVNADIQLSDELTLTSITSWDRGTFLNSHEDSDGTPLTTSEATYYGKTKQIAQDFRLTSDYSSRFNFIVGAYFNHEEIDSFTDTNFFTDVDVTGDGVINAEDCVAGGFFIACNVFNQFEQEKTSYALYSDFTYDLTEQVTLRGGLRYTHDKGKLNDFMAQVRAVDLTPLINTIPGSETDLFATTSKRFTDDNVSGKIGVDYSPADAILLYASYSQGYRGAAFSGQAFYDPSELTVAKPEKVEVFEAGFKTELLDHRVRFNGSAFWYNYKNQQFINVDPETTAAVLINLPKARIYGAEFDVQVMPTANIALSTAIGLLDTEVERGTADGINVRGNRLINAPSFTMSSAIDWTISLGDWGAVDARVDVAHASGQYYDILNRSNTYENGYTLVNSRIRFYPHDERYGIAFWAKNLTNELYYTNLIDASGLGYTYSHVNAPRTYGVTFDMRF